MPLRRMGFQGEILLLTGGAVGLIVLGLVFFLQVGEIVGCRSLVGYNVQ